MCIAIADIDHFKQFNDQYGHQVGDEVLIAFWDILQKFTPKGAIVARLGGEEFIMVLPQHCDLMALEVIENFWNQIEKTTICAHCHNTLKITASFGIAQIEENLKPAIINADRAL